MTSYGVVFLISLSTSFIESASEMTAAELMAGIAQRYHGISNLTMLFKLDESIAVHGRKPRTPRQGEDYRDALGDSKLGFQWLDAEVKIDGARRFKHLRAPPLFEYAMSREEARRMDKVDEEVESWNGVTYMSRRGRGGSISVTMEQLDMSNYLFWYVGWSTLPDDVHAQEQHHLLPGSVNLDRVRVRPERELVNGCWCYVMEEPLNTIWIDPDRGYAVARREIRHHNGDTREIFSSSGWKAICEGVWLPNRIERRYYGRREEGTHERVVTTVVLEAEYRTDVLADSDFLIEFPPGTRVFDESRGVSYTVPRPGEDPFDVRMHNGILRAPGRPWSVFRVVGIFSVIGVVAVALVIRFVRMVVRQQS